MSYFKNRREDTSTFVCDQCGEELEMDGTDFHDALDEAKDKGWRPVLECGEWLHFCEGCKP